MLFLLGLFLFVFYWYSRMQLKEQALELATAAVEKNGYQLLDEAIGLSHMRIFRQGKTFSLMQTFEFQYADEHEHRHMGQVIRYGKGWLNVKFHLPTPTTVSQKDDCKVIPFPGTYRHD